MTDAVDELPATKIRNYVAITEPDVVDSFLDPVRRAILVALRHGKEEIQIRTITDETVQDDGTKIRTIIEEEKPVKRFWMTVPEIVRYVRDFIVELDGEEVDEKKFKYNCYYHLPKLREQGLVEQYPPPEFDDEGKETSGKRGVYYRRTAKVFVVSGSKMSGDTIDHYLNLFSNGFEVQMTDNKRKHFEALLLKQIDMLDDTNEYLAAHLKEVDVDATALSDLLTGMAYIFLSDNEDFLKIQRELKQLALTPCCGPDADMKVVCSFCGDPLSAESALTKMIDGKGYTFCDDECATSFEENCNQ